MKPSGNPSFFKICLLLMMFVSYTDTYVFSKPRGGQVVSGTASFTQDGNLTVITAGNRSVINYQSFDIGKNETVQFVQPNAHSTVLNRVTTPDPTNIFGHLDANGIVVISNPYGVFFQNGSVINVGGLIAGAGKVSDADFTAGKIHFTDLKGDVRNDGVIAADNRIALMGANVTNTGSLTAARGVAMMVSGPDVYVGEKNGNIFVRANGRAVQTAAAASKSGGAGSVSNSGTVAAPRVLLGAGDMYSTAIVNSGLLQGRSIAVNAGKTGSATVGGTLDATSARNRTATDRGGSIDVLGGTVALKGATLDASGTTGGGGIRVGGDFHGEGTLAHAATTTVDAATTIKADATASGDGGTVVLWSDAATDFSGHISTRGGAAGGNGGQSEVSSHNALGFSGVVDADAPAGRTGSLLLDPSNIRITAGGAAAPLLVTTANTPGIGGDTLSITQASLEATTAAITLTASNDIRIDDLAANGNGLTLQGTADATFIAGSNAVTVLPPSSVASVGSFVMANPANFISNAGHAINISASGVSVGATPPTGTVGVGINGDNSNAISVGSLLTQPAAGAAAGTAGGAVNLTITAAAISPVFVNGNIVTTSTVGAAGAITIGGASAATLPTSITTGTAAPATGRLTATATGTAAGSTGAGGAINLTSTGAINLNGVADGSSAGAAGGAISITSTGGNVGTGNLKSTSAVSTTAAGGVGSVAVTTPGTLSVNAVDASSASGPGGGITLGANGQVPTGIQALGAVTSSGTSSAGNILALTSGNLTLTGGDVTAAASAGTGGIVQLLAKGAVSTANLVATSAGANPGAIIIGDSTAGLPGYVPTSIAVNTGTGAINTANTGSGNGGLISLLTNGTLTLHSANASSTGATGGLIKIGGATADGSNFAPSTVTVSGNGATPALALTSTGVAGGAIAFSVGGSVGVTGLTNTTGTTGAGGAVVALTRSGNATAVDTFGAITTSSTSGAGGAVFIGTNGATAFAPLTLTLNGAITATSTGGSGGAVTLASNGVINAGTNAINTFSTTGGAGGNLTATGTALTLGALDARGGSGTGGTVALTASTTALSLSTVNTGSAGSTGGGITLTSPGLTSGALTSTGPTGGGNVLVVSAGPITLSGAVNASATGATGSGGSVRLLTNLATAANTDVSVQGINTSASGNGNGGLLTFANAAGANLPTSLTLNAPLLTNVGGTTSGAGGAITLLTSGVLAGGANALNTSSAAGAGGSITASSTGGGLTLGALTSTAAGTGSGGAVSLTADGALTVGAINASAAGSGSGGAVGLFSSATAATPATPFTTGAINTSSATGAGGTITVGNLGAPAFGPTSLTVGGPLNTTGATAGAIVLNTNTLTGAITFLQPASPFRVTLTGDTTLIGASVAVSDGSATPHPLNFDLTNHNLLVSLSGGVTVDGAVGGTTGKFDNVNSFTASGMGITTLDGNFSTGASQTYGSASTLVSTDAILHAGTTVAGGSFAFNSPLGDQTSGAHNLSLVSGTAGSVVISQPVGGGVPTGSFPLASLTATTRTTGATTTVDEPVTINAVGVTTTGNQSYGPLFLGGTGGTTLNSTGGTGTISAGPVTGAGLALTVNTTGAGSASTFVAINGAGALNFNVAGVATFNGPITATSLTLGTGVRAQMNGGTVMTVGVQTYGEGLLLGNNLVLTTTGTDPNTSAITFNSTLAGAFTLATATSGGNTVFGAASGSVAGSLLTGLTTSVNGTTIFNDSAFSTNGTQNYQGAVVVQSASRALALTTSTTGNILFGKTLDSTAANSTDLTLTTTAAGSSVTFTGPVGGGITSPSATALNSLTVTSPTININGGVVNTASTNPRGTANDGVQTYNGNVLLGANTTFVGKTITSTGTVTVNAQNHDLTLTLSGLVTVPLGGFTNLNNFTSNGTGGTSIAGSFSTAGYQHYDNAVTLSASPVTLTAGTVAGQDSIRFGSTLNSSSPAFSLTLTTGGPVTFTGLVGNTGPLGSLTTTGTGTNNLNGGAITTTNGQSYGGPVVLGPTGFQTTLTSNSGGVIGFTSTVNGNTAGTQALITSTSGSVNYGGAVGGSFALKSLTANGTGTTNVNGGAITTTGGGQSYTGPVAFGSTPTTTVLSDTTTGNLLFSSTVNNGVAGTPTDTFSTGGNITFGGAVGNTGALGNLTATAGGTVFVNGGSVRTSGTQTYNSPTVGVLGAVSLGNGATTTFSSTGSGTIKFDATVNGAVDAVDGLTVTTGGTGIFNGVVGNLHSLASLTSGATTQTQFNMAIGTAAAGVNVAGNVAITGPVLFAATGASLARPTVFTTGSQSYAGGSATQNVALIGGTTLSNSATLNFAGNDLSLRFGGGVTVPGFFTNVRNFLSDGAGGTAINNTFNTSGTQTYSNAVTLSGTPSLTSVGNITFNNPVDGNAPLTLNATGAGAQAIFNAGALVGNGTGLGAFSSTTAGGTIFNMNAGSSTAGKAGVNAASVIVSGPVTFNEAGSTLTANTHPSILTTGLQTYSGAATLAQDTSLVSSGGGAISFNAAGATINSASATLRALNTSTTGVQTYTGLIGNTFALGGVTGLTTGPGATVFNMVLPSTDPNVVPAGVRVSGPVVTSGPITLNVGNSSLTQPSVLTLGSGSQTYGTLTNPATTVVTLVGPITVLNSANTESPAGTFNGGGVITFNGNIVSGIPVTGTTPELDVRAGEGTAVFTAPINTTGNFAPGGASVIFNGSVGPLGTFTVLPNTDTGAGIVDLNIIGAGVSVTTGGFQLYNLPTVLSTDTTLQAGGNVTFVKTLDGDVTGGLTPHSLGIASGGTIEFQGQVGGLVPLRSLLTANLGAANATTLFDITLPTVLTGRLPGAVNVVNSVAINTTFADFETGPLVGNAPTILSGVTFNSVVGTGAQTYDAALTVGQNTILQDLATPGGITFNGTINALISGGASLSVNAVGDETFNQLVGNTNSLSSLATDEFGTVGGSTRFKMDLTPAGTVAGVRTTGAVSIKDNVVFNTTGGTTLPTILSGGAQTFALAATLTQNTVLTATSGNVLFSGPVDSATVGAPRALTVSTPGNETFQNLVGATAPLLSLTTDATLPVGGQTRFVMTLPLAGLASGVGGVNTTGAVTINDAVLFQVANSVGGSANHPSVASGGTQTYAGAATLGTATILTSTGGSILFNSTLDSNATPLPAQSLVTNTPTVGSTVTFGQAVGGNFPLASLTMNGAGTTRINGGVVGTTGTQLYGQTVTIGQDATLTSTGPSDSITFVSSLDGTRNLAINAAGTTSFAAVGNTSPLLSLGVTAAGTRFNYTPALVTAGNADVNIVGALTINGPVFFNAATVGNVVFVRTGVTVAGVTPVPTSAQDYVGAFTLAGTATFTDLKSGAITFEQTVDSAASTGRSDLTASTGGTISFLGPVGATTPLTSLTTSNLGLATGRTIISGGSVVTSSTGGAVGATGAQTYNDAVFLGATTALTSIGGGDVTFARTLDSLNATPQSLAVNTSGRTIFGGMVGAINALASLTTDNATPTDLGTQINGSSVATTGAQTYNDSVTLGAATALTSTGGGNITFARTLDSNSAATPQALTVNTSGQTILGGAVGATFALASLTTDDEGAADLGTFINGGTVTTTGAQIYNDAVTLGNGTTLASTANGTLVFNGTLDGAFTLQLNTGGQTIFNRPVGGSTPLLALTTDNVGVAGESTQFNMPVGSMAGVVVNGPLTINDAVFFNVQGASLTQPGILTIGNGNQTYNGPVSLQTNTFLVSAAAGAPFTGGGAIVFTSPLGIASAGGSDLFIRAGVGTTTLSSAVNAANVDLGGALVTVAGPVNVTGTFSVEPNAGRGGSILFGGGSVTTTGAQIYNVPLVLGNNTTLTSTGGGDITFLSTLDGAFTLALNTSGSEIFGNTVGGLTPLVSLTTDAPAAGQSGGRVIFGLPNGPVATLGVITTGAQTYNDAALLRTNAVLTSTGGSIAFAQTVDGAFALALNALGDETFNGHVGGTTPLLSLVTDDPAAGISGGHVIFNVAGSTATLPGVTTTGLQSYHDAATLNTNTVLASTGGGDLTFFSTVDSATSAAPRALTLDTTGNEIFNGRVGGARALLSLVTDDPAANTTGGQVIFNVPNGGVSVTTTTFQTYNDAVSLAADTNLTSTGSGALTFASTIDGAFALTLNSIGTTTFQGAVGGGTPLAGLTTASGAAALNGGFITTTGLQSYGGAVLLGADTLLASTVASGGILFTSTLNSAASGTPRALTLNAAGDETFNDRVGGTSPLLSLTTDSTGAGGHVIFNIANSTSAVPGVITTTFQTYNDAALLQKDTALTSTGGGTLTFASTVDSGVAGVVNARALRLNTTGDEVFGGVVGGINPLFSLITDETNVGGRVIFGLPGRSGTALAVTTVGSQIYNDAALLQTDTTLTSNNGGTLTFASTVDGPFALNLGSTGNEEFFQQVGGTTPLASLTTDASANNTGGSVNFYFAGTLAAPSVTTTGAQTYRDAAILRADTALVSTQGGRLTFDSTVDNSNVANPHDLTLNTSGNEVFGGLVGASKAIGNLTTDAGGNQGGQTQFNMSLAGQPAGTAGVNVTGAVTVNDTVLFSAAGSNLNNVTVQSTGAQNYGRAATLGADTFLASTAGTLTFGSTVDGRHGLTLNTPNTITFSGAIGRSEALASLATLGGAVTLDAGVVNTTGAQSFSGPVMLTKDTSLTSSGGGVEFGGTVDGVQSLTLTTAGATTFDQAVGDTNPLTRLTANDGSAVVLNSANVTTLGLQTYGGTLTINRPDNGTTILRALNDRSRDDTTLHGNLVFKRDVSVNSGSLLVQGRRILAQADSDISVAGAGRLDLEASDTLILRGSSYGSDNGAVVLNDPQGVTAVPTNLATIFLTNTRTLFHGGSFDMGYLQNMYSLGSIAISVPGGVATLSDIAASGSLAVTAGTIVLRARDADGNRGGFTGGTDDGLTFVARTSINFGNSPIRYDNTYSRNNQANFVTRDGLVTVNRDRAQGISIFQDQTLDAAFQQRNSGIRFSDDNFATFSLPFQPISGGTQTIDTAAALSGALPDQKPIDVAVDITVTAGQMEELKKLGIHPRVAAKQERRSLSSKRALFAQLVDGQDTDNYGMLQPVKGGISRLVPSDYVVVVDRMSEREVQAILTSFEELYGKNKEKAPPIGEAFNTAFTDYTTEKQTADAGGFAPYIQTKPGKYPDVDKAVRGFDSLFGYIESLGLTAKEQEKSKEHIVSDLQVSGVPPQDMVKVIDTLRSKIPQAQKAPSTKLPPSPPASAPAPGATNPAKPEKKKEAPLKTARLQGKKEPARKTVRQGKPTSEDRLHEVAGL